MVVVVVVVVVKVPWCSWLARKLLRNATSRANTPVWADWLGTAGLKVLIVHTHTHRTA